MNVLELVPALESIIGKVIQDPNQAGNLKLELAKLDVQQEIEKYRTQAAWLSNKSPLVAGAIPCILWMVSVVIFFNHILAPLLMAAGLELPTLELPAYYTDLAATIVLGLFAKKAWDSSDINIGGFRSPAKKEDPAPVAASLVRKDDPEYHDKRYAELVERYSSK
ncbi:MAG: hypothetical protein EOM29_09100 [Bacteroidia bacterium]|nr:hypothetical protein [Bacteroidia bacterium]